jgi:hypothetical protein
LHNTISNQIGRSAKSGFGLVMWCGSITAAPDAPSRREGPQTKEFARACQASRRRRQVGASLLNGAKATGERLNDPFFEKMKSTGIEVQWSNPSFLVTHEKSIIVVAEIMKHAAEIG